MINFFKKYWPNILAMSVFTILLLYFIPHEKNRYFEPDVEAIQSKSNWVVFWMAVTAIAYLIFIGLRHIKKSVGVYNLAIGTYFIAACSFFCIRIFILSGAFFLNALSKKETIDKIYSVQHIDKEYESLLLLEHSTKKSIRAESLLIKNPNLNLNKADTIVVSFKRGLLGFNFDPEIKSK